MTARLHRIPCFAPVIAVAMGVCGLAHGQQPSIETAEARTALQAALAQVKELQAQLGQEREASHAMAARATAAAAESNAASAEARKLRQEIEALGAPGLLNDERGLQKRLLDALNDLRLVRDDNKALTGQILRLSGAVTAYLRAGDDQKPQLRLAVESEIARLSTTPTGVAKPVTAARIETSQVVSTQPEHKLVVINAGDKIGLKVGTPVRFYRNDRPLATALVVDVRPNVSGALVTTTATPEDFPQVGDSLRIDTSKN